MSEITVELPRPRPARTVLKGHYCRLEPLDPARHSDDLFAASMGADAARLFRYLFDSPQERPEFQGWMERSAASDDPLFFGVIDVATGRCEGRQTLMRITPEHGVIEIGNILWGPGIARTRVATEALYLFARYAIEDLGYRRFEWKCDAANSPSMRAAERFGFAFEGIFRQHMVVKGRNRDTAWFSITDAEWKQLRPAYDRWLDRSNFNGEGQQQARLEGLREAL